MNTIITAVGEILTFMLEALKNAWPYLLISIPISVAVNVTGAGRRIRTLVGRSPVVSIILATLIGALSPLCACSVIPVIFSLLTAGVPLGPVMSFWIASPSMDPEIFFLSVTTLGWNLAVWRLASTFILSLGAGFITHALESRGWFKDGILRETPLITKQLGLKNLLTVLWTRIQAIYTSLVVSRTGVETDHLCCATGTDGIRSSYSAVLPGRTVFEGTIETSPVNDSGNGMVRRIKKESLKALLFVGKFMLIAYLIEALIVLFVPDEIISAMLGGNQFLAVGFATVFGLPFYTTNLAALGIVGGLLEKGMLPGAALAFLISGPVTTLPAMSAVFGIAGKRVFVLYLSIAFVGAIVFGTLFGLLGAA